MKKFFAVLCVALLLCTVALPCFALTGADQGIASPGIQQRILYYGNFADYFTPSSFVVENLETGVSSYGSGLELVQSQYAYEYGTSYFNGLFAVDPSTPYRVTLTFDSLQPFDLSNYSSTVFQIDSFLRSETVFGNVFDSLNRENLLYVYKTSNVRQLGTSSFIESDGYLNSNFSVVVSQAETFPKISFVFYFKTTDVIDSGAMSFPLYLSDFKILSNVNAELQPTPDLPTPPGIQEGENIIDQEGSYRDDIFDLIPDPDFNLDEILGIFDEFQESFVIVKDIYNILLSIRFILVITSVSLFVLLAMYLVKLRR